MHELEEGGEVLFPGSEGDQDDDPSGGETVGWSVVTSRTDQSGPGSVLQLRVQVGPGGGQGQLLLGPHHGGGTEDRLGGGRRNTGWLSLVLAPCCTSGASIENRGSGGSWNRIFLFCVFVNLQLISKLNE